MEKDKIAVEKNNKYHRFSIIVPVYNVEKYLYECLESLVNIKYSNYEIVIVNDGSKDNSVDVANIFVKRHNNIKLINQENQGLGYARNTGIRNATGEYLIFVDSDDYLISEDIFVKLNEFINKHSSDVVCYNHTLYNNSKKEMIKKKKINVSENAKISTMIKKDAFSHSACTKCISKKYINEFAIYFNKGFSEDLDWSYRLLLFTNKIAYINEYFYCYRINREGSITTNKSKRIFVNWIAIYERCLEYSRANNGKFTNQNNANIYLCLIYSNLVVSLSECNIYKDYMDFIKNNKKILKYAIDKKSKILNIMYKIFGVKVSCAIIRLIKKV